MAMRASFAAAKRLTICFGVSRMNRLLGMSLRGAILNERSESKDAVLSGAKEAIPNLQGDCFAESILSVAEGLAIT
jgi:hypothetical protein